MRLFLPAVGFLAALALSAAGCGDTPQVYRKIPRANPKTVAVGAAAVAGALTLAGAPSRGGPKKEKPGRGDGRPQKSNESVPADVLDRLDDTEKTDDQSDDSDCDEAADTKSRPKRVELIPSDDDSSVPPPPKHDKKKCKDRDDPDEDDEQPAGKSVP